MSRRPSVRANPLDRAIAFFDPAAGAKRVANRWRFEALTGGYKGARKDRRPTSGWSTREEASDTATLPDLSVLRARSHDLIRNNPLAAGALNTKVTSVVGTGLKVRPEPDAEVLGLDDEAAERLGRDLERVFRLWAENREGDLGRQLTFAEQQDLVYRSARESGDVLVLKRMLERSGSPFAYKLHVIEAGRLSNPNRARDTRTMAGGVEVDANGAPIAFHVADRADPWKGGSTTTWARVGAYDDQGRANALHVKDKRRVPDLAPVVETLKQLSDYTDGELQAAVVSSFFTVFMKTESGADMAPMEPASEIDGSTADKDYRLGPGAILGMGPTDAIETANPGRPNDSFDPFVQAVLRQIGVCLEIPFELLVKHFTASYSAARAALLEFWKYVRRERRWFVVRFCQPVFEDVVTEAVMRGIISLPGFLADPLRRQAYLQADWYGDAMPSIDPLKENKADEIAEDRGWKTAAENTAEKTGGSWDRKVRRRAKERAAADAAGMAPPVRSPEGPDPDGDPADGAADKPEDETRNVE